MECYYCRMNEALEKEVVNPHHGEIHPTCAVCEYDFELMRADEKRFQVIRYLSTLSFFGSVIGFFYRWQVGVLCIIIGIILKFVYHALIGSRCDKRNIMIGIFAKEKGLKSFFNHEKTS